MIGSGIWVARLKGLGGLERSVLLSHVSNDVGEHDSGDLPGGTPSRVERFLARSPLYSAYILLGDTSICIPSRGPLQNGYNPHLLTPAKETGQNFSSQLLPSLEE